MPKKIKQEKTVKFTVQIEVFYYGERTKIVASVQEIFSFITKAIKKERVVFITWTRDSSWERINFVKKNMY